MIKTKKRYFLSIAVVIGLVVGIAFAVNRRAIFPKASKTTPDEIKTIQPTIPQSPTAIENMRDRSYSGSMIQIEKTLSEEASYTSYLISYKSDNLKIYGVMNMPNGSGSFPVIILNHGYYSPSQYASGDGSQSMAAILAQNGYLTLASDYRGYGGSDDQKTTRFPGHRPEYALDVLNLLASVKTVKQADINKIGMWGHSMGGEVALRVAEVNDKLKAIVLWAPTSANASDNAQFYGGRHGTTDTQTQSLLSASSPMNYLRYITTPISLHQGLSDTEVKPEWSKALNTALKKEEKTVEYFEYPGQDHNFRNLGWDTIAPRTVAFFDKYVKENK